jgi:hypothetical protein
MENTEQFFHKQFDLFHLFKFFDIFDIFQFRTCDNRTIRNGGTEKGSSIFVAKPLISGVVWGSIAHLEKILGDASRQNEPG